MVWLTGVVALSRVYVNVPPAIAKGMPVVSFSEPPFTPEPRSSVLPALTVSVPVNVLDP